MEEFSYRQEPLKQGDWVFSKVKKYEIIEDTYDKGGFGRIYRAIEHSTRQREFALKEFYINDDFFGTMMRHSHIGKYTEQNVRQNMSALRDQFFLEAKTMKIISNKVRNHIPQWITQAFEYEGRLFYAMEYIKGKTLTDEVKEDGSYSEEYAIRYITQISKVLSNAHDLEFAHRDVSPNNIIINRRGAVLVDFGNANAYNSALAYESAKNFLKYSSNTLGPEDIDESLLYTNEQYEEMHVGTRGYIAPWRGDAIKSDIFSLAATLHFMLTSRPPLQTGDGSFNMGYLQNLGVSQSTADAIEKALMGGTATVEEFLKDMQSE